MLRNQQYLNKNKGKQKRKNVHAFGFFHFELGLSIKLRCQKPFHQLIQLCIIPAIYFDCPMKKKNGWKNWQKIIELLFLCLGVHQYDGVISTQFTASSWIMDGCIRTEAKVIFFTQLYYMRNGVCNWYY